MFFPSKLPASRDARSRRGSRPRSSVPPSPEVAASSAQRRADLVRRPDVELALLALAVGVLRGVEAALGDAHLAQHLVERLLADAPVALVSGPASRAGRRGRAGRCRRASSRSGGRASARRLSSGRSRRRAGRRCRRRASRRGCARRARPVLAAGQQAAPARRRRELRRAAEAAVRGSACARGARTARARLRRAGRRRRGSIVAERPQPSHARRGACSRSPRVCPQGLERPLPAPGGSSASRGSRPAGSRCRRRRGRRRGQEDGHRPAALAGHRLHRLHVDRVDVGALLAVDLDADEVARSCRRRCPASSKDSRSITWHQWQAE